MHNFKKIDFIFIVYLLVSSVFLFLSWSSIESRWYLLLNRLLVIIAITLLVIYHNRTKNIIIHFIRTTYPIILSGYYYSETVFYNKLFFSDYDWLLASWDDTIFGSQLSIGFSNYFSNLFFSELMYFSYFSFYLLIIGFTVFMYLKRKNEFEKTNFHLIISLYIFYLIFCMFPSAGPQFYFDPPQNILPNAFVFDKIMHFIQETAEQPTGAFPSSHVGISVIILLITRTKAPNFFKYTWPLVFLIIMSTVYIKAHYVVDVIGGVIIAPFILYLSNILFQIDIKKLLKRP